VFGIDGVVVKVGWNESAWQGGLSPRVGGAGLGVLLLGHTLLGAALCSVLLFSNRHQPALVWVGYPCGHVVPLPPALWRCQRASSCTRHQRGLKLR